MAVVIQWLGLEAAGDYLAKLGSRRTGSETHNQLIDHIQGQLESLGLHVYSDVWRFSYDNLSSLNPGRLAIGNSQPITVSSTVPYSGHTSEDGVEGPLISLMGAGHPPKWAEAAGGIAVVEISNPPVTNTSTYTGVPSTPANTLVTNLTAARDAGVRAIVYVWDNISDGLAAGLYAPFHSPFFGIPAVYVSGKAALSVRAAVAANMTARVTLPGRLVPDTPTRNIWVVIPGTALRKESVIINTHTDGTNIAEENGHIALLQYARSLVVSPPRRTTVLAFVTAHIHSAPFSTTKRSTTRWLADHPELWNSSVMGGMRAAFGSCVEHLGARSYVEDLSRNNYEPTGKPEDELLYAATPELATLVRRHWSGAGVVRVMNPTAPGHTQFGEGLPLLRAGIPEVSLVTAPSWLLKEFPTGFDERSLVDLDVLARQVASFERIWREADSMDAGAFGVVAPTRGLT
ncbi:hypothetical protein MAPG_06958 [Magnaporthiopsis poae ATCC 64411]|uniref:PA domain-containing protein n=1 Tax=Magnaporthiopsis poae (strain ATCC 64411 / 73-15) TaxID=644358 RepID=A0A0C4E3F9_MAGP6|nr:hypothetical protein MAPG_06958 [Magnaporthiopsis poae ATCC 64411]